MARTIAEIKNDMTRVFIANDTVKALYGLIPEKPFEDQFSKTSLESILFYVVATCAWTLEKLFDRHKQEVTDMINELKPHSLRWYANKAKAFQCGRSLEPDSDLYDNTGLTDEQIREQQVVKYSAVMERDSIVYVKVATGPAGNRTPLTTVQQVALADYFQKVKDAGVKLKIVNEPADEFGINIDVYYDPQVFDSNLDRIDKAGQTLHNTIASFVENLPFNGEYRNSALIKALTELDGVVMVQLNVATAQGVPIDAKSTPESGYFKIDKKNLIINAKAYEPLSE